MLTQNDLDLIKIYSKDLRERELVCHGANSIPEEETEDILKGLVRAVKISYGVKDD